MDKKGSCLIISGGSFSEVPADILKADCVIACDLGLDHADRYGIKPDIVLGDFDSLSHEKLKSLSENDYKIMRYPKEKDDTDTSLAMKHALELGYKDIRMVSVFGKRMDHAFSNIQTAHYGAEHGAVVRMYAEKTEAVVFSDKTLRIPQKKGYGLSVFSLTDKCRGVGITGTKYELKDADITNSFPIGQSNEFKDKEAVISVTEGVLMVLTCAL